MTSLICVPFQSKDLPTYIRYKIRMDADSVDSTMFLEDRISRPGPRGRRGIDLKYIYYGFAFLQDTLEHAIIAEQSGRNMSDLPGITLQQFPYPCYITDQVLNNPDFVDWGFQYLKIILIEI
jgi:ATP-binding cassette, subfamily A (ABC1), member 1